MKQQGAGERQGEMMSKQIAKADRLKSLIESPTIKKRFDNMLGNRSASFISSVLSAVNSNELLRKSEPMSVITAAATAAAMDLPITPSLGFAHIVPYGDKAQFQIGWKGYVQLAMRSGQYKTINLTPVLDGQIKKHNSFTGEMEFQEDSSSEEHIGYLLYFKLINGYEKYFYMTKDQCQAHGKKYSKSYARGKGKWADDFESMALKTVCKMGLSKYGVLSLDMQKAMEVDQGSIAESGHIEFLDNENNEEPQDEKDVTPPKKKSKSLSDAVKAADSEDEVIESPAAVQLEDKELPI